MQTNELISVIVPVYNVKKYLVRCINSLISQTYNNLEIILVNDGSTDESGEICDQFARLNKKIRVIHKENGGLSDARNVGIETAKGSIITFIDSDDWVHHEYVKQLYYLLIAENADISVANYIRTSTEQVLTNIYESQVYRYSNRTALRQYLGEFSIHMIIVCGKLFKKELFKDIRFPIGRIHEDEFTTYKLIFAAKKIVLTTAPMYYYWQRTDSIMGSGFNIKHKLDLLDALHERAFFFNTIKEGLLEYGTYRRIFRVYREMKTWIRKNSGEALPQEYEAGYLSLKKILKITKQPIKFMFLYKSYYIAPRLTDLICSCCMILKSFLKNNKSLV